MPGPGKDVVPGGQCTRRGEQRFTAQVGGDALVPVHRDRNRGGRAADIAAPVREHKAYIGSDFHLHHRPIRVAAAQFWAVSQLTVPLPAGFTSAVQRVAGCVQGEVHIGCEGAVAIGTIIAHVPFVVAVGQVRQLERRDGAGCTTLTARLRGRVPLAQDCSVVRLLHFQQVLGSRSVSASR